MFIRIMPVSEVAPEQDARLRIEYKNTQPIEVVDFTKSLLSVGGLYKSFIIGRGGASVPAEAKLYVKTIREGSIITDLIPYTPLVMPFMHNVNGVVEFSRNLFTWCKAFLGEESKSEINNLSTTDLQNIRQFLEPTAREGGSNLIIAPILNGSSQLHLTLGSVQASAIQNEAQREIAARHEPFSGIHTKVLLYFYQIRDDAAGTAGDFGVIDSISRKPLKVIYDREGIKEEFLREPNNLFSKAFVVDVEVQTINEEPKLFKVLALHEIVDR